jgi:hypothetical protein
MPRLARHFALFTVACVLLAAFVVGVWGGKADSSEAQGDTIHNCPPAGKWSIAVWDGAGGTAAGDALATCGTDAVAAAYSLDSQTGAWSRWFAGKPDVSNLAPLSDMQGVLALGAAAGPAPTATATATPVATETPPTVPTATATPSPTATAGAPQSGIYNGTTSQGRPIEFDVAAGSQTITRIKFQAEGTCGTGCTCQGDVEKNFGVTPPAIVDNAFSYSVADYDISGTFGSTTTASGNLDYHHNGIAPGDADCDSGPLTWTASLQ